MVDFESVLPCVVLLIAGGLLLALLVHIANQRRLRAWGELARRHALRLYTGPTLAIPYVSGVYRGRDLVLDTFERATKRRVASGTRLTVRVRNSRGLRLYIRGQTLRDDIDGWLGSQDVQTGDPELDVRLHIQANSEMAVRRMLEDEALRRRMSAESNWLRVRLVDDELRLTIDYWETGVERLQGLLDLLSDLGDRIEHVDPFALEPRSSAADSPV